MGESGATGGEFALIDWIRQRERESGERVPGQNRASATIADPGVPSRGGRPPGHDRHADGRPALPARPGRARGGRLQGAGREPVRHRGDGRRCPSRRWCRWPCRVVGRVESPGAPRRDASPGRAVRGRPGRRRHQRLGRSAGHQRDAPGRGDRRGAVRRAGARPGDAILVTGPLGGSLRAGISDPSPGSPRPWPCTPPRRSTR